MGEAVTATITITAGAPSFHPRSSPVLEGSDVTARGAATVSVVMRASLRRGSQEHLPLEGVLDEAGRRLRRRVRVDRVRRVPLVERRVHDRGPVRGGRTRAGGVDARLEQ